MLTAITYFALTITLTVSLNVSEECTLKNGHKDHCWPFNYCDIAQEDLKKKVFPQICKITETTVFICCANNNATEIKTKKSISSEKCKEYPTLLAVFQRDKIVSWGGNKAPPKLYPHMALLGYGDEDDINWACGGSLISEKFVLTAAHCINTKTLNDVKFVRLGDLVLNETNDDAEPQNFTVKRTFLHPQFKPPSVYHDIGLIELDRPAILGTYVSPACLYTEKDIDTKSWRASGWGVTENFDTFNSHLTAVNIRPYSSEECRKVYDSVSRKRLAFGIDDELQICAGDVGKDTCGGDSGGPLQVPGILGGAWRIIGITSFGKACVGLTPAPGVYTRVSNYIEWIESIVWP